MDEKAAVAISEKLKSARNNTSRRLITDAKNVVAERYMEPDFPWIRYAQCLVYPIRIFQRYLKKKPGNPLLHI